jgi:hypothetical protein
MVGPITPEGPGKVRWIAVLVDDFSAVLRPSISR